MGCKINPQIILHSVFLSLKSTLVITKFQGDLSLCSRRQPEYRGLHQLSAAMLIICSFSPCILNKVKPLLQAGISNIPTSSGFTPKNRSTKNHIFFKKAFIIKSIIQLEKLQLLESNQYPIGVFFLVSKSLYGFKSICFFWL